MPNEDNKDEDKRLKPKRDCYSLEQIG